MDASWLRETALSGSLVVAAPLAILAGLVSFFSPCVLPLLPGYVSYATGVSGADLADGKASMFRGRMFAGTALFVLGFGVVFVSFGMASSALGNWLIEYQDTLTRVGGVLIIVMGLVFLGAIPLLQRDWRLHKVPGVGLAMAPVLGIIFGIGWAPCVGPTLGAIMTLGLTDGSISRGGFLAALYALGLGVPFLIAGLAYERTLGALSFVRKHQKWVTRIGGVMLILVGLLLVSGAWNEIVQKVQVWVADYGSLSI